MAFQDQIKNNHCWGCGSLNERGLQIKSRWDGDESVCTWTPDPMFMAGPRHFLYGGTIASLIDCHCICTAIANAYTVEGRQVGEGAPIWYATGTLNVRYLSPTPIDETVELRARITGQTGKSTNFECSLRSGCRRAGSRKIAPRLASGGHRRKRERKGEKV
jgi:acyl-coenzyme A thioesterase PaaI-like protein